MCDKNNNTKDKSRGDDDMNTVAERPCTPFQSLETSLKEMKLIRNKQLPKKTWKELKKELEKE